MADAGAQAVSAVATEAERLRAQRAVMPTRMVGPEPTQTPVTVAGEAVAAVIKTEELRSTNCLGKAASMATKTAAAAATRRKVAGCPAG